MNINQSLKTKKLENLHPLVSVVIPVFNGASYLEEAVNSVQKSTFKNFEILLIDDKSTDQSRRICKTLMQKYSNVYFYAFRKNKGLGHVLNFALKRAQGKYIARLNQDDSMYKNRLQKQVNFLDSHENISIVGSCIKLFNENGEIEIIKFLENDEDIKKIWHIVGPFSDPSVMYRKDLAIKAGGYFQEFWPADDTHLWYRLGLLGKLANLQEPLVEVRWHKNAASVLHFRKLAISTYKMHRWAHENISKAPLIIQFFWLIQLLSGLILPPSLNWNVYRSLKRIINFFSDRKRKYLNIKLRITNVNG